MSIAYALFISVIIGIIALENYGYGYWEISRPVFAGPLIGLIMGDLQTGLTVGATIELMYLGIIPVGGSIPPNAQAAGLIGTAIAITSGGNPEIGIALALPIGIIAQLFLLLVWNGNIFLVHRADRAIERENYRKMEFLHLSGLILFFLQIAIPAFLAIYFGSGLINTLVEASPDWIMDGLSAASKILPAVGIAMLIKIMDAKKFWPFLLLGFTLSAYLELNTLSVALIGLSIAAALFLLKGNNDLSDSLNFENAESEMQNNNIIKKRDLHAMFYRSFFSMTSINYERYQNLGFNFAMLPALKKIYSNNKDLKNAVTRHMEFFNCHPYPTPAVLGMTLAMEEKRGLDIKEQGDTEVDTNAITATKTAMMGPLAGIGDSVFKATLMTIFASIGASLAVEGNWFGSFVFIIPMIMLNLITRYYGLLFGYKYGAKFFASLNGSKIINRFVESASIVGLSVIGSMIVGFVAIKLDIVKAMGETEINAQEMLDQILPYGVPLAIVLIYLYLLNKIKEKGIYVVLALSFIVGLAGAYFGIFDL